MRVVIEDYVKSNTSEAQLAPLCEALSKQGFADTCCIGGIQGTSIILRCPDAKHGVIADASSLSQDDINRIIAMLEASV